MLKPGLGSVASRAASCAGLSAHRMNAPCVLQRLFHAASPVMVRQKHLRRLNRLHKHWAKQMFKKEEEWVDPMLGRQGNPFLSRVRALIGQRENQIDLLEPESTSKLLFNAERSVSSNVHPEAGSNVHTSPDSFRNASNRSDEDSQALSHGVQALQSEREKLKRDAVLRILSLQNASSQQNQKQAMAIARSEFQRFEGDTGSPEVQAAVATIKIQFVAAHAKETKKDLQTKRRLEHMVQMRRNILLYLKRTDPRRYIWTIEKLGLSDATVSAEFHMSRQYLWRTQFYGDKTLPMKKTVKDTKKARELNAKRSKAQRYLAQHDPDALIQAHM